MKTIYKYEIEVTDRQLVQIPICSEILCAQMQNQKLCIWAMVDTGWVKEDVVIRVFGTGHEVAAENLQYIDTFQLQEQNLVFHVFKQL